MERDFVTEFEAFEVEARAKLARDLAENDRMCFEALASINSAYNEGVNRINRDYRIGMALAWLIPVVLVAAAVILSTSTH